MKINKKFLATAGATLLLFASAGAAYYHYQRSIKKPYDYSAYYVPSPVAKAPVDETEEEPDEEQTELSLTLLKETNKDVVGIIEFDERMIYEPVVQAPDNEYYVRRNIDRDYASAGIPFVTGDGSVYSTNVVIYGHSSTRDDIIFTPLMNYTSYDFYTKHPTFRFEMEDVTRVYQIFAVLSVDTKDPYDTLEFAETEWRQLLLTPSLYCNSGLGEPKGILSIPSGTHKNLLIRREQNEKVHRNAAGAHDVPVLLHDHCFCR